MSEREPAKSAVVKRSVIIAGHKTSVSLEDAFWRVLKDIARVRGQTLSDLVSAIDAQRAQGNLSSALRLFVLDYCQHHGAPGDRQPNDTGERVYVS
jgi:predicted DNA-binding ribbon-helix-helix protein